MSGRGPAGVSLTLLLAACAMAPPADVARPEALAARIHAVLERRGLGADALSVIDNIVRHETPPPPAAPPLVRELLARPLDAMDAASSFDRAVPAALLRLVDAVVAEPRQSHTADPMPIQDFPPLAAYLEELSAAQHALKQALGDAAIDGPAVARDLGRQPPAPAILRTLAASADTAQLTRASTMFLDATARFVGALRAAESSLQFPARPMRVESAVGPVVLGTRGDDAHRSDAALIIDPGGNDVYERAPATGGAISVIIDLGGDDRYQGADVAVHGLSALIDGAGNDQYAMTGSGLAAAIAGTSVLVDVAGDDRYEGDYFSQGAAAFGLGALVDLGGRDAYRVRAGGQGFGMAGGVGVLWDRGGDDAYKAAGLEDAFKRGGGISSAQGAAFGFRTSIGAGIGLLRDDAGDDTYEAEMFAQGIGFYYGVGVLWDRGGNDRYRAVRYAQGNGVHEAVGVLQDVSGDDHYELTFGVGQGMGLDLAVGVLRDDAGDDRYRSQVLAQGAATANGLGILLDAGGEDRLEMGTDRRAWGRAEWLRGLPTVGLLLHDPARAEFVREGVAVQAPRGSAEFGGPLGDAPIAHESSGTGRCPEAAPEAVHKVLPLAEALRRMAPGLGGGVPDPAAYAAAQQHLRTRTGAAILELPRDSFNVVWALGAALTCTLRDAAADEARTMWTGLERLLEADPATPFAGAVAGALRRRAPEASQLQRMLKALDAHPQCGVRVAALSSRLATAKDAVSRAAVAPLAQRALRSPCWRLQVAARNVLGKLNVAPDEGAALPSFLAND